MAVIDQLQARSSQLHAMLALTYGAGHKNFQQYSDEIQDSYLWAAANAAQECMDLASLL